MSRSFSVPVGPDGSPTFSDSPVSSAFAVYIAGLQLSLMSFAVALVHHDTVVVFSFLRTFSHLHRSSSLFEVQSLAQFELVLGDALTVHSRTLCSLVSPVLVV